MSTAVNHKEVRTSPNKLGLAFWMNRVLEECERAAPDLAADPVHDLRVSLRRCRSMADGIMAVDPDPAWEAMRKAGKRLFSSLGDLRDVQVMEEWVQRLGSADDAATVSLLEHLQEREHQLKEAALSSLGEFDRKHWAQWSKQLPRRAARFKQASALFKQMALERWYEAHQLHGRALRGGSKLAWHRLRIGLKRLRYVVENFLPHQHAAWKDDLKELQDLLGEVHDLDVLWATALEWEVFPDNEARSRWHARILEERSGRIAKYRSKMLGKNSLWQVWRAELPQGKEIEAAEFLRMKLWASFRDPDFQHSTRVARLALQLFDGLARIGKIAFTQGHDRSILRFAALGHDVGRVRRQKNHHKISYRLIRQMPLPLGWQEEDMKLAAAAARYHRGALPRAGHKAMAQLLPAKRQHARRLAAILRLADAFDGARDGRIRRVKVSHHQGVIIVSAEGYSPQDRLAESIAAARHLLEMVCRCPVIVQPWRPSAKSRQRILTQKLLKRVA
ncbi:MAG TPA: CHAD domain-containing protein [Terriglobales bacterium]|nr:CHAD domain-containing protein [Terriglobales bacterium]